LGYRWMGANGNMNTPLLFAGVLALTVLGLILFGVIEMLERLAMPYREGTSDVTTAGSM
jgi:NitT/TauT family transport system permease protein